MAAITTREISGGGATVSPTPLTNAQIDNNFININVELGQKYDSTTTRTANTVLAAPNGSAGSATFRALVAADIPTLNQSTTGNAATATTLQTARTIGDVSFNGSANIVPERIDYKDTRGTNFNPETYRGITLHLKTNTTDNLSDGGTYHGVLNLQQWSDLSGGKVHQIGLTDNNNIFIRANVDGTTWGSWSKVWTDSNDGAGSGLDADLLDGNHASAFYLATNPSGFTSNVGTVTSVGGTGTVSGLTLSGTVTTSGNLTLGGTLSVTPSNFSSQTANTFLAAPNGSAGVPTFRALVAADVPTLNQSTTGNASTATTLQTTRTINGTSFNGSANIDTTEWIHSGRDFPLGTLVQTTIDYSVTAGDPWVLEIKGNAYGSLIPFDIQYQGYIYTDTIINHGGYSNGTNITGLVVFNYNGKLCFWWPSQTYWHGYNIRVYTALSTRALNKVTTITNEAKPAGVTKEVALSANIRQSLHSTNYNTYSPTLTGTGASGTWGISITGNAATVTNGVYTNGSYADPAWITSLAKSKVGLANVENTALSTWAGSTNITTIGAATATSLSVTGNLTVNGTTTTVNSTTVTIDDPIFTLGGDTAPTTDDNKDRGIEFRWHNGTTSKVGFFGYDDSTGYLTFIPDATNSSEVFSGALGDIQAANFRGNLIGNADTATSASTIDGVPFNNSNSGNTVSAPDSLDSNGIGYVTNISLLGQTDGALYSQAYSSSWQHQIYGDYRTGQMAIRGKNSNTWQAWRTVLDSSNYNSYSPTLTGGGASGSWGISVTGTASNVTGTVAVANGGTGQTTVQAAINALAGAVTNGQYLRGNGTNVVMSAIQAADVPTLNQNTTGTAANVTGTVAIGNGGTGATTAPNARTNLGATTVGGNLFTLANPGAITFLRVNADNTVSALDAATFRTAIGAGTSSTNGTVTSVAGSGTVSGLSLGGTVTTSGNITLSGTLSVVGSNFGSQTANHVFAAPNGSAGNPGFRALVAADIPTLNQNTTGTAANVTGTVAIGNGGTGATTAPNARTNLGATTVGSNLFTLANPSAVTFLRVNADNTVSALDAATFRGAIGAGTSSTNGTVTSVAGSGTVSGLSLSGTVTTSGNLTLSGTLSVVGSNFGSQTANHVFAAPNGSAGNPGFRALVAADIPTLNQNTTGTAANVTGTVAVANGGTGQTTVQAAINALAGAVTNGQYLRGNGTNVVMSAIQAADVPTLNQNTTGTAANVTGTVAIGNGGTGATTAPNARTNLGATTVGSNLFTLANPSAVTFLRVNADNTVSALDAATFRGAIGAGTSSTTGTVTSVGGTGTVSGLSLSGTVTTSGNLTLSGTLSVVGSNFGSQTANHVFAAPNGSAGNPGFRALVAADIPTLNQNTTGNAGSVTNGVYTNGSYADPSWITSLSETKVLPSQATHSGKFLTTNGTSTSWSTVSGGITYTRVTSNTTLVDKQGVIADTSGGTFTVTLPATPATGAQVAIADGANWGTTNLTVARNGSTIENLAEDLVLDIGGAKVDLIYDGTTWEVYSQAGTGGSAVDLNSAQTLTNKTISFSNNTLTGVASTGKAIAMAIVFGG